MRNILPPPEGMVIIPVGIQNAAIEIAGLEMLMKSWPARPGFTKVGTEIDPEPVAEDLIPG